MRVPLGVTTSSMASPLHVGIARDKALAWGLPYIERPRNSSVEPLLRDSADALLILALAAPAVDTPGDRIAPMVFAGAAAHFPLTDDKAVSKQFLNDLGAVDLPPGSDALLELRVRLHPADAVPEEGFEAAL